MEDFIMFSSIEQAKKFVRAQAALGFLTLRCGRKVFV